jgi:hypothetical protein
MWMSDGFRWVHYAGNLLALTVIVALLAGGVIDLYGAWTNTVVNIYGGTLEPTRTVLNWLAASVLASAVTIVAAQARLTDLATHARPVVGIILDVDNHLRESPEEATPRAKMAERYVALLKFVLERRDPKDPSKFFFNRVVIVSHSQGTVITADLLRYLVANGTTDLQATKRVRLITMGCPLRQLYAAHFPDLYHWVEDLEGAIPANVGDGIQTIDHLPPDPARLGVGEWVNLYTSGDYVGRPLWRSERSPNVWSPSDVGSASGDRRDRCLGAGTHTHYWTSAVVAEEIDDGIA